MRRSWPKSLLLAACLAPTVGCVDRRFVVNTNVPGANIYVDGVAIGSGPADNRYDYTGWREIRAVATGYEPLVKRVKFEPHWYDYPGLDLFAEVLWPFRIEDVRHVELTLEPARPPRNEELQDKAEYLRSRGLTLPPPSVPNDDAPPTDARPTSQPEPGTRVPTVTPPFVGGVPR